MNPRDPSSGRRSRWRFLGSQVGPWLLCGAVLVLVLWFAGVAMLLIELMQAITGAGSTGCP